MAQTLIEDPAQLKLETLLSEFYVAGWEPGDDGLGPTLLEALRESGSPIPAGAEAEWTDLIEAAFGEFCCDKALERLAAEDL